MRWRADERIGAGAGREALAMSAIGFRLVRPGALFLLPHIVVDAGGIGHGHRIVLVIVFRFALRRQADHVRGAVDADPAAIRTTSPVHVADVLAPTLCP